MGSLPHSLNGTTSSPAKLPKNAATHRIEKQAFRPCNVNSLAFREK
jgi:hypothetical protein